MQIHFYFLPTAQHSNGGEETPRRYNSILLPDDLAIPSEENHHLLALMLLLNLFPIFFLFLFLLFPLLWF